MRLGIILQTEDKLFLKDLELAKFRLIDLILDNLYELPMIV